MKEGHIITHDNDVERKVMKITGLFPGSNQQHFQLFSAQSCFQIHWPLTVLQLIIPPLANSIKETPLVSVIP